MANPLDDETTSLHFAGLVGPRIVVGASFYSSSTSINPQLVSYQLRYMATDFDSQGRGYASLVLGVAETALHELAVEQVWANARDTALGFYVATGWDVVAGSEHLSTETGLPHTVIYKLL